MEEKHTRQQMQDQTPWEGDYRELSVDDFMENVTPKHEAPIMLLKSKHSMSTTVFWSMAIIIVSLYQWLYGSRHGLAASYPTIFEQNELWRLWTSLFVHADFGHIASNLWLFSIFGFLLHAFWGAGVFPYLSFGVLGGLTSYLTVLWYGNPTYIVGASGMIYGMIGIWLVTYCFFETRYRLRTRFFRAIGFVLIMLFPSTIAKNVSYSAHAIGFVVGIGLAIPLCLLKARYLREKVAAPEGS